MHDKVNDIKPKVIFFTGHGRQGTTLVAHMFASCLDVFNLIENSKDPLIDASVKAYKKVFPMCLIDSKSDILENYFLKDKAWVAALKSEKPIVCKSPWNTLIVPCLRRIFPDALFINVRRFPHDTIASIKRLCEQTKAFAPVREHSVNRIMFDRIPGFESMSYIVRWAHIIKYFHETYESSIDDNMKSIDIRFEDIVNSVKTKTVVEKMISFADVKQIHPLDETCQMISVNANKLYGGSGVDHPVSGRVGRFVQDLTISEAEEVYSVCSNMIDNDELYRKMWTSFTTRR